MGSELIIIIKFANYFYFFLILLPSVIKCTSGNECTSILKCGDCIRTVSCVWCKNPKFAELSHKDRDYVRCNTLQEHERLGICEIEYLENPRLQVQIENKKYDESSQEEHRVQVKPRSVSVRIRVGQVINVTLEYYDTENKPLDLYYVMDLSATMADDKRKVATLGTSLAKKIQNLTSNVKIGFGSFIDKPIKPFVSINQLNKEESETTTAPYGFKNHLSLTHNINRFQEEVGKSKTSGNLDAPEGVLDAIMQAVTCKDVIGWRSTARHLLVISTDGPFHMAGDAKFGGILKPNDCKCHMTREGNVYSESTTLDYPSIAQVNAKVKEGNIFVIFAVTEDNVSLYTKLSERIEGSAIRILKEDSANVVDLVEQEYKKIITSIELPKFTSQLSKFVRMTYYAKCIHNSPYVKSNKCQHDMEVGSNTTFQIEVEVIKCPRSRKDWKQTLKISPLGIAEGMLLNLELICDCPCQSRVDKGYGEDDSLCEGNGTPRCGICDCRDGHIGRNCQCSSSGERKMEIDDTGCEMSNSSGICSNRGSCVCGQCVCNQNQYGDQVYSGTYCQCDDGNCPVGENGQACSGQGTCKCSKCICTPEFMGDSCGCSTNENECREPGEESTCSGRGYCKCGRCVCESPYSGRMCQNCPNCPGKCEEPNLLACIHCYVQKLQSPLTKICIECEYLSEIKDVEEVFENSDEEKSCFYHDENGCERKYVYGHAVDDQNKMEVRVGRRLRCPLEMPIIWLVLGIMGSVLIGGMVLLILWKFILYYHDLREWKKFKKEIDTAKWHPRMNPLYKEVTSTFQNPAYRSNPKY